MNQPQAYIHPNARIAEDVKIEPFAWIGEDVEIGSGCWIGPNATIMDGARIGKNCKIVPGAVISAIPQDLKYQGETTYCYIGDGTTVRESATVNKGTAASGKTVVGKDCLLMAFTHVAHDCYLGDQVIMSNVASLAGHIVVDDWAILGGLAAVSQFCRIGAHVMISGGAMINKDIPPYVTAARMPIQYCGLNTVGLNRHGFTKEQIDTIQRVYRIVFQSRLNTSQALARVMENEPQSAERDAIVAFIRDSQRGVIKGI